jgi:hypothetical protein
VTAAPTDADVLGVGRHGSSGENADHSTLAVNRLIAGKLAVVNETMDALNGIGVCAVFHDDVNTIYDCFYISRIIRSENKALDLGNKLLNTLVPVFLSKLGRKLAKGMHGAFAALIVEKAIGIQAGGFGNFLNHNRNRNDLAVIGILLPRINRLGFGGGSHTISEHRNRLWGTTPALGFLRNDDFRDGNFDVDFLLCRTTHIFLCNAALIAAILLGDEGIKNLDGAEGDFTTQGTLPVDVLPIGRFVNTGRAKDSVIRDEDHGEDNSWNLYISEN